MVCGSKFKKNMAHKRQDNTPTSLQLLHAAKQVKQLHPTFGVKRCQRQIMVMHPEWVLKINNTKRLQKIMKKNGMTTLPASTACAKDKDKNRVLAAALMQQHPRLSHLMCTFQPI